MKKIVVLVSGAGTNLKALIKAINRKKIKNGKISLVISSNEKAKALTIAKRAKIDTKVIGRKNFDSNEKYQDELFLNLKNENPDLIVLAGFMQIVSKNIVQYFENKIINIHPSLIPSFCGAGVYGIKVHQAVLQKGVKITGATVHFVNEIPDGGPIILQKSVKVNQNDTPEILQERVKKKAEWKIFRKAVNLICQDKIVVKNNKTYVKE